MPEEPAPDRPADAGREEDIGAAARFRDGRRAVLDTRNRAGLALVEDLTSATLAFLQEVATDAVDWTDGWALAIVGGTGRRELCPGSDVDLLLLHPAKAPAKQVSAAAERLWYPLWDAGLKISPAVHTIDSAVALGDREVISAVTWLSAQPLVGDESVVARFADAAARRWRDRAKHGLIALFDETDRRHARSGEVAFHLEPDLREGRGGLRDAHVLRYIELSGHASVSSSMERPLDDVLVFARSLLGVRAELHRQTGRASDRLALQEQDAVASALGYSSADELMATVAAAGREIAWSCQETMRRVRHALTRRRPSRFGRPVRLAPDVGFQDGEVVLLDGADLSDPTLTLRTAATAALQSSPIARETLCSLAEHAPAMPDPWPERARNALVALLGAGEEAIHVLEALDRYDLLARALPEWAAVRSKPQRNAYHRFTVDRHLNEAAVNAATLVRSVARPDLLLIGTWLHDIGKGYPGDHTDVGVELVAAIGKRMGFGERDVEVLVLLVRHHLLLAEVATRRDLSDPGTINSVAAAVGDVEVLRLLSALTEADSLATGATAWSDWKARLIRTLTERVTDALGGLHVAGLPRERSAQHDALLDAARQSREVRTSVERETEEIEAVALAAPDQTGLFAAIAGSLAVLGAEIVSADVWTTDDGMAIDLFRTTRRLGGETNWRRLEAMVAGALDGSIDLSAELEKRAKSYARRRIPSAAETAAPSVFIDNATPELATLVEVRAPDGPAVLYRVAHAISALGLDLRTAKVATIGHEVVDAFAVRRIADDGSRTKLDDLELQETLRRTIVGALADG